MPVYDQQYSDLEGLSKHNLSLQSPTKDNVPQLNVPVDEGIESSSCDGYSLLLEHGEGHESPPRSAQGKLANASPLSSPVIFTSLDLSPLRSGQGKPENTSPLSSPVIFTSLDLDDKSISLELINRVRQNLAVQLHDCTNPDAFKERKVTLRKEGSKNDEIHLGRSVPEQPKQDSFSEIVPTKSGSVPKQPKQDSFSEIVPTKSGTVPKQPKQDSFSEIVPTQSGSVPKQPKQDSFSEIVQTKSGSVPKQPKQDSFSEIVPTKSGSVPKQPNHDSSSEIVPTKSGSVLKQTKHDSFSETVPTKSESVSRQPKHDSFSEIVPTKSGSVLKQTKHDSFSEIVPTKSGSVPKQPKHDSFSEIVPTKSGSVPKQPKHDSFSEIVPSKSGSVSRQPKHDSFSEIVPTKSGSVPKQPKHDSFSEIVPTKSGSTLSCKKCGKVFSRLDNLKRHEKHHGQDKAFKCAHCQRKYSRIDSLNRHNNQAHSGERVKRNGSSTMKFSAHRSDETENGKDGVDVSEEVVKQEQGDCEFDEKPTDKTLDCNKENDLGCKAKNAESGKRNDVGLEWNAQSGLKRVQIKMMDVLIKEEQKDSCYDGSLQQRENSLTKTVNVAEKVWPTRPHRETLKSHPPKDVKQSKTARSEGCQATIVRDRKRINGSKCGKAKETRRYVCKICNKTFPRLSTLKRHHQGHSNVLMQCSKCWMVFKRRDNLKRHEKQHTNDRVFECTHCQRKYTRIDSLNRHINQAHRDGERVKRREDSAMENSVHRSDDTEDGVDVSEVVVKHEQGDGELDENPSGEVHADDLDKDEDFGCKGRNEDETEDGVTHDHELDENSSDEVDADDLDKESSLRYKERNEDETEEGLDHDHEPDERVKGMEDSAIEFSVHRCDDRSDEAEDRVDVSEVVVIQEQSDGELDENPSGEVHADDLDKDEDFGCKGRNEDETEDGVTHDHELDENSSDEVDADDLDKESSLRYKERNEDETEEGLDHDHEPDERVKGMEDSAIEFSVHRCDDRSDEAEDRVDVSEVVVIQEQSDGELDENSSDEVDTDGLDKERDLESTGRDGNDDWKPREHDVSTDEEDFEFKIKFRKKTKSGLVKEKRRYVHVCNICNKTFPRLSSLKRHHQGHSNVLMQCSKCWMVFKRKDNLKRHEKRHSQDKAFECIHCKRKYTRLDSLNRHINQSHRDGERVKRREDSAMEYSMHRSGGRADETVDEVDVSEVCVKQEQGGCKLDEIPSDEVHADDLDKEKEFGCKGRNGNKTEERVDHDHELDGISSGELHADDLDEESSLRYKERNGIETEDGFDHDLDENSSDEVDADDLDKEKDFGCKGRNGNKNEDRVDHDDDLDENSSDEVDADDFDEENNLRYKESNEDEGKKPREHVSIDERDLPNQFSCSKCRKVFTRRSNLKRHEKHHTNAKAFECLLCQIKCTRLDGLQRHFDRVHKTDEKDENLAWEQLGRDCLSKLRRSKHRLVGAQPLPRYRCNKCGKIGRDEDVMRAHQMSCTDKFCCRHCSAKYDDCKDGLLHEETCKREMSRYFCKICGKEFRNRDYLLKHQRRHSGAKMCEICRVVCKSLVTYKYHKRMKHATRKEPQKWLCTFCGKGFNSKSHFRLHEAKHAGTNEEFPCDKCDKVFECKSSLIRHINTVQSEVRNHLCRFCGKAFKSLKHVKAHEMTHNDRIFKCQQCGKGFTTSVSLRQHEKLHSGVKPFKCSFCDTWFASKAGQRQHEFIHKGVKQHTCEFCDKKFTLRHHLKQHLKTHSDKRPYVCTICGDGFKIGHHLTQHMATHENRKN